jgi:ABC-2 type transport system ATP-binding protein
VVVISKGELRARGPLQEVLGGDGGPVTEVRSKDRESLTAALKAAGHAVQRDGDALIVPGATPEEVGVVAGDARIYLTGLAPRSRSLEQAFFQLTGGGESA